METLDGILSKVMFSGPNKYDPAGEPFVIAKLSSGQVVKGKMSKPQEGFNYRFWGDWKPQKGGYADAFEFSCHEALVDRTTAGQAEYLVAYVDGIGRGKAHLLCEHFGPDTLDILRATPERAMEVPGISITPKIIEGIKDHFEKQRKIDPKAFAKLTDLFNKGGHRISRKTIERVCEDYGSNAPDKILGNPYLLLAYPRMGWKTVDSFAITTAKYDPVGLDRQQAALVEAIEQITLEGHTYGAKGEIEAKAYALINMIPTEAAWHAGFEDGDICGGNERFSVPLVWHAEQAIVDHLARLQATAVPLDFEIDSEGLKGDQIKALEIIQNHGVSLLIGPPGCGKSYTIAKIVRSLIDNDIKQIRIVAPTGKAAKRASELLRIAAKLPDNHVPCSTIHRALQPVHSPEKAGVPAASAKFGRGREGFAFGRDEHSPLPEQVIIIDESSMVDVRLMASLLCAIASGTRVIFVGDQNQLPSVGPGSVLRDMIAAGLPTACLEEIKRSDGGGRVVRACHAIKDGMEPSPAFELEPPTENWIHIEETNPAKIAQTIVALHDIAEKMDPIWDFQVISAQKSKHLFACDNLNYLLSQKLNPDDSIEGVGQDDESESIAPFRINDKVIRIKNGIVDQLKPWPANDDPADADWRWDGKNWMTEDCPVVNGDMGTVLDIVQDGRKSSVVVKFRDPDRICRIPYGDHHLQQAYAVTVHKAQGSGFKVCIAPVHTAFYWDPKRNTGLFSRELFYTAISRAEEILITVGQWAAVRMAVTRQTVHQRRTRLAELITNVLAEVEV